MLSLIEIYARYLILPLKAHWDKFYKLPSLVTISTLDALYDNGTAHIPWSVREGVQGTRDTVHERLKKLISAPNRQPLSSFRPEATYSCSGFENRSELTAKETKRIRIDDINIPDMNIDSWDMPRYDQHKISDNYNHFVRPLAFARWLIRISIRLIVRNKLPRIGYYCRYAIDNQDANIINASTLM